MKKSIPWDEPVIKFSHHFGYGCKIPGYMEIDNEKDFKEFSDLIDKSIEDDFDYTIEAYGTVPPKSFEPSTIFID